MADGRSQDSGPEPDPPPETVASPGTRGRGRSRPRRAGRDLTRGSVRRHLWYLGWPQIAEGAPRRRRPIRRPGLGRPPGLPGDRRPRGCPVLPHAGVHGPHGPRLGHEVDDRPRPRGQERRPRQPRPAAVDGADRRLCRPDDRHRSAADRADAAPAGPERRRHSRGGGIHEDPVHGDGHTGLPSPHWRGAAGRGRSDDAPEGGNHDEGPSPGVEPDPDLRLAGVSLHGTGGRGRSEAGGRMDRAGHEPLRAHREQVEGPAHPAGRAPGPAADVATGQAGDPGVGDQHAARHVPAHSGSPGGPPLGTARWRRSRSRAGPRTW